MTGSRVALLALAAAATFGCGGKSNVPQRVNFRLPSAIAVFRGRTVLNATGDLKPYLVVANEGRNDLTLVDATNDVVLDAPVLLRPLAVDFPDRPAQLASASLGDAGADLLVGVSAGSSVLQLVSTWTPDNAIETSQSLELGADVLQIVPLPPPVAGTARLAVALAGRKLALVEYARSGDGIVKSGAPLVVHGLDFEPAALAIVPGDGAHLYAATLDPIGPGAVQGVAEIDLSAPAEPWPVRALDARAPTRLVAAARLVERAPGAVANDETAFAGQPQVTRIYAVLDEASCGPQRRIDCGIVTLDPAKTPGPGDDHIPDDWAGWMPYRAPIQVRSRPLVLAVSGPPAVPPSDATYTSGFMRLVLGSTATAATSAVGMAAGEIGSLDFYDLGRFKIASESSAPLTAAGFVVATSATNRIWFKDPATGDFAANDAAAKLIHVTPGYAQDEVWTASYQGALPGLTARAAEAGWDAGSGKPWLAVQFGDGVPGTAPRTLSQVARLYHPALGVKVGDIVAIKADTFKVAGVKQCDGETPPGTSDTSVPKEFETVVTALLPPSDATPGGAVLLDLRSRGPDEPTPPIPPGWQDCWDKFTAALRPPATTGLKGLLVTVDAGDLVLTGGQIGYAGRPRFDTEYAFQYKASAASPDEDALAAACPLADWDGSWPAPSAILTCGGAGCDRDVCEQLVLARKVRRRYHLAEDCNNADGTPNTDCLARYPDLVFPIANGPALRFEVGHQTTNATTTTLSRGLLTLTFSTSAGVAPLTVSAGGATTQANGVTTFDRSPFDPTGGYRFYVSYPGNQVADVSPSLNPINSNTIR